MITKKSYEEQAKGLNSNFPYPMFWACVSENVGCHGYPERETNDWFVFRCCGILDYPFVRTTLGRIPLYRCYWEEEQAKEEVEMRKEVFERRTKELKEKRRG